MICDHKRALYLTRIEKFWKRISDMIVGPTVNLADATSTQVERDLLEWNNLWDLGSGYVEIAMKAFEIRTFKILNQ